jgi:hypothetical protein
VGWRSPGSSNLHADGPYHTFASAEACVARTGSSAAVLFTLKLGNMDAAAEGRNPSCAALRVCAPAPGNQAAAPLPHLVRRTESGRAGRRAERLSRAEALQRIPTPRERLVPRGFVA